MNKFLNLIKNENMKIYRRLSTLVMLGALVLLVIGIALLTRFVAPDTTAQQDWKAALTQQNEGLKKSLEQPGLVQSAKDQYQRIIDINEYRIEHNIPPEEDKSLWGFVLSTKALISLISLFVIVIGAGAVANEFSTGTIKLLLIRPSRRWKILLSKYISTLLSALVMLVILFVASVLVGGLFFGVKGFSLPHLSYIGGQVRETNIVLHVFAQYGLSCVDMLMMVTFAFMVSTVFRNNALAIGLSVFLMFTGNIIVASFSRYEWVKYILFANTDLSQYIDGIPVVKGMTMSFSILMLILYFAVFNAISWTTFMKRDVGA